MGVFRVPPGAQSHPHYHAHCESAVYMIAGALRVKWGDHLEQELLLEPGDLIYVPPRETHILENVSDQRPGRVRGGPRLASGGRGHRPLGRRARARGLIDGSQLQPAAGEVVPGG